MFRSLDFVLFIVFCHLFDDVSAANLNGIYTVDSCECSSAKETCEPTGPFLFDQNKTKLTIKFGPTQIGSGLLSSKGLDITLNQTHCKGSWNIETHVAELKCEHHDGILCATNLRCIVGACLTNETLISLSSSSATTRFFSVNSVFLLILLFIA